MEKTHFLATITDDEQKKTMQKLFDKAEQTYKYGETRFSDFCSADILNMLEERKHFLDVDVTTYGGYDDAERKIAAFSSGEITKGVFPISAVRVNVRGEFSHRDYLGSIIGCGVSREKIGDILVDDSGAVVVCSFETANALKSMLTRIGGANAVVNVFNLDELSFKSRGFRDITSTVASLRLDSILALMLKTSRTKSLEFIKAQKVFVNGALCQKGDRILKQDDVITVRGKGKAVLSEIGHESKKGRTFITVKKYI